MNFVGLIEEIEVIKESISELPKEKQNKILDVIDSMVKEFSEVLRIQQLESVNAGLSLAIDFGETLMGKEVKPVIGVDRSLVEELHKASEKCLALKA